MYNDGPHKPHLFFTGSSLAHTMPRHARRKRKANSTGSLPIARTPRRRGVAFAPRRSMRATFEDGGAVLGPQNVALTICLPFRNEGFSTTVNGE
jgi:hypothetical protein